MVTAEGFAGRQRAHPALHRRHHEGEFEQAGDDPRQHAAAVGRHQRPQQRVAGDHLAGQGTALEDLTGVARRLAPGVGVRSIAELASERPRFTLLRMQRAVTVQPGMA
jgi:hypothetical protein